MNPMNSTRLILAAALFFITATVAEARPVYGVRRGAVVGKDRAVVSTRRGVVATGPNGTVVARRPVAAPLPRGYIRTVPVGYRLVAYRGYNCYFVGGIYYRAVFYEGATVYVIVN